MRAAVMLAGVALAMAGCSGKSDEKAARNAAAANYVPPSVTSRADFGGSIERRFNRLDKNNDTKLTELELGRRAGLIKQYDKNGDGALDSSEWGTAMLSRFDTFDTNKDGTVTSDERQEQRAARRAARAADKTNDGTN